MPEDFTALYKQALEGLRTGGKKLEASLQEIEEGKKRAIAGGGQALVSGGLGGTTVMGAIPLAAEKGAARKRLAARGEAEQTYLTTLASFAAFAQRGVEAQKERESRMQLAQYGARQAGLGQRARTLAARETGEPVDYMQKLFGDVLDGGGVGGQAQQFPSLYGAGDGGVPDWTGGGAGDYQRMDIQMAPFGGQVFGTQEAFETSLGEGGIGEFGGAQYGLEDVPAAIPGGGDTVFSEAGIQPGAGAYAPRSRAESIAATRAGYYGSQGQQLKPYTRADAERLGFG